MSGDLAKLGLHSSIPPSPYSCIATIGRVRLLWEGHLLFNLPQAPPVPIASCTHMGLAMHIACLPHRHLSSEPCGERGPRGRVGVDVGVQGECSSPFPSSGDKDPSLQAAHEGSLPPPPPPICDLCSTPRPPAERAAQQGRPRQGHPWGCLEETGKIFPQGKPNTTVCFRCLNYTCYLFLKWPVIIGEWGRHPASQCNQNFRYCCAVIK